MAGQDGTYLAEFLLEKGYDVYGIVSSEKSEDYLKHKKILKDVKIHVTDLKNADAVQEIVKKYQFDEIYNLASFSSPALSYTTPKLAFEVNSMGVLSLLEGIRKYAMQTRLYQASTSELYGGIPEYSPQDENTHFHPKSPYGVSKLSAHWLVVNYRESYGLKCCAGILFNHSSPRRNGAYVTRKICDWVKNYRLNSSVEILRLGNLDAKRDWGHSKDFVKAMWMMLHPEVFGCIDKDGNPKFEEYVVGTGGSHTVRDVVELALDCIGRKISWKVEGKVPIDFNDNHFEINLERGYNEDGKIIVEVCSEFWRPAEVVEVKANYQKIEKTLGWKPKVKLEQIIHQIMQQS